MNNENKNFILDKFNLYGNLAVLIDSEIITESILDIIEIIKKKQINFKLIELSKNGLNILNPAIWKDINRVFIAISENHKLSTGHIQAILEVLGLDYTGTGMLSAMLTKDIVKMKKIWQMMGIATAPFVKYKDNLNWQETLGFIGLPIAIKSSNINEKKVFKVNNIETINETVNKFNFLNDIIIEPWITGDEYAVYIINDSPLIPLKINGSLITSVEVGAEQCDLAQTKVIKNMQQLALESFLAIGGQGFAKVNILKDVNEDCWVSSINIGLNLYHNSNFAIAAYNSGIKFEELVEQILATSFIKKPSNNLTQLV